MAKNNRTVRQIDQRLALVSTLRKVEAALPDRSTLAERRPFRRNGRERLGGHRRALILTPRRPRLSKDAAALGAAIDRREGSIAVRITDRTRNPASCPEDREMKAPRARRHFSMPRNLARGRPVAGRLYAFRSADRSRPDGPHPVNSRRRHRAMDPELESRFRPPPDRRPRQSRARSPDLRSRRRRVHRADRPAAAVVLRLRLGGHLRSIAAGTEAREAGRRRPALKSSASPTAPTKADWCVRGSHFRRKTAPAPAPPTLNFRMPACSCGRLCRCPSTSPDTIASGPTSWSDADGLAERRPHHRAQREFGSNPRRFDRDPRPHQRAGRLRLKVRDLRAVSRTREERAAARARRRSGCPQGGLVMQPAQHPVGPGAAAENGAARSPSAASSSSPSCGF